MKSCFTLGALVYAAALGVGAQSPAPAKGGNPEAAKIKNPVEANAASVAAGKRAYQRLCVRCHGPEGQGDGTAATGAVPPSDLTDAKWDFGSSDGDIYAVVHDGVSADMEGYAARLSETEIWNVVNYVKSLGSHR